jgi:hypothetical protein
MINEAYWTSEASAKPPGCEPGGVSSQGRGGDARGIKPSELGGVLQDRIIENRTTPTARTATATMPRANKVHMGNSLSGPPNVDQA